jgi:hypothetical protein
MTRAAIVVATTLIVSSGVHAQTRFTRDFSADVISQAGGHQTISRFYASKSRTRSEILHNGEVVSVMLMDYQNHTGWNLRPRAKVATDMSAFLRNAQTSANKDVLSGAPPDPNNPCAALRGYTCRKLGSEDVDGRHTQKWEMKDTSNRQLMTVWIDPSLPLAVKTQWDGGSGEFRNIREEPQPDSLFEVPSDYKKVPSPFAGEQR